MRKIVLLLLAILTIFFLVNPANVSAVPQGSDCDPAKTECDQGLACDSKTKKCVPGIAIEAPKQGFASLGNAISNILVVAFAVAALAVLVMLILGSFEWITSGGDKEAVGKARGRIINALIGLAVLAIAFALTRVAAQFTGVNIFNLIIPTPAP